MKESEKRTISIIIILALFIGAAIVFFTMTWPMFDQVLKDNRNLALAKAEYQRQVEAVRLAKTIVEQYKNLTDVNQMISLTMPRSEELYNAIVQLNKISEDSGLSIQSIALQKISSATTASSKTSSASSQSLLKSPQQVALTLSLNGTYESFKTWLEAVETNIRLMDITNISFSGVKATPTERGGDAGFNFFNFSVALNLYYQP